jgi:hypothetical protein
MDHVCGCDDKHPCYAVVGRNYKNRSAVNAAKKSYSFHRSGVVNRAKELAKNAGQKSCWLVEENTDG